MNQKINGRNKINKQRIFLQKKMPNTSSSLNNENKIKIIISLNSNHQIDIDKKLYKKENNLIENLPLNSQKVFNNKILNLKKVTKIIPEDSNAKVNKIFNGEKLKNLEKIFEMKKKSIKKEKENEEESYRKNKFFKNNIKKENERTIAYISKNNEINNKENKKNNEKKNENNLIENNIEKPEDISDYINIDEKEYNNNYQNLNRKITNEAIEEVEEAKEVSELQSSEFYNNISNSRSSNKNKKIFSIKDIGNKKDDKTILFNKCYTLDNQYKSNKKKIMISKIRNKKITKNNKSVNINVLDSNDSSRINENKTLKFSKNINNTPNTSSNNTIRELGNKTTKDSLLIKKNNFINYIIKPINTKLKISINSYKSAKNTHKIYIKRISINTNKNELNNKYKIYNIKKSNTNQINEKTFSMFKNHYNTRKLEKYKNTSKTMPNLKKKLEKGKKNSKDILLKKNNSIKICYNNKYNYRYISNRNNEYRNKMLKSMKIKIKENTFLSHRSKVCPQNKKYLSEDKFKELNKTNINMPLKIYEQFFKEEHIKYRNKRRLITQERYHNLFKEYYLKSNRNNSKDSLNKQTKNIPKYNNCKNSITFKK